MTLESKHTFLTLFSETEFLTLEATDKTEVKIYEDSLLKFSYGANIYWTVPIKVSFTSCTLTDLKFAQSSIKLQYKIGVGE